MYMYYRVFVSLYKYAYSNMPFLKSHGSVYFSLPRIVFTIFTLAKVMRLPTLTRYT